MPDELTQLEYELRSTDEMVRSWAAVWAGNFGLEAVRLLPALFEMVSQKLIDTKPLARAGEFVSIGRILRRVEIEIANGTTDQSLMDIAVQSFERVVAMLKSTQSLAEATPRESSNIGLGQRLTLLIYILIWIGPRSASAASLIERIVHTSGDERIRHRAYQFAYVVAPELLNRHPWKSFAPVDSSERLKWKVMVERMAQEH